MEKLFKKKYFCPKCKKLMDSTMSTDPLYTADKYGTIVIVKRKCKCGFNYTEFPNSKEEKEIAEFLTGIKEQLERELNNALQDTDQNKN